MRPEIKIELSSKLESVFSEMKAGKRDNTNIKTLENILRQYFHKNFTVKITNPPKTQLLFVMSITPTDSTVEKLISAIINQRDDLALKAIWDECNDWMIEIDSRIFDSDIVDLSKDELAALILHEIGHNVYSNSIPQRVSKVIKFEYAKVSMLLKRLLQTSVFGKLLSIPILDSCAFNVHSDTNFLRTEIKADGFVAKMGYRDALVRALTKFSQLSNIDKSNPDERMEKLTKFSFDTIEQFRQRQNVLVKRNISSLLNGCPSDTIRNRISSIYNSFFVESTNNTEKGSYVKESEKLQHTQYIINKVTDDFYDTEFFLFGKKKVKRIDPADLDYIDVQKANIKTNDDKMLLISYIYSKLETVQFYLDILNNPKYAKKYDIPHTKNQLVMMKDRLVKLRDDIVAYKIPEIRYGIQVNYPSGYEG